MNGNSTITKTKNNKKYRHLPVWAFLIFICSVFLLAACSPKSGNGLLRFFFDGVPVKDTATVTLENQTDTAVAHPGTAIQTPTGPQLVMHKPYLERACSKCHNSEVPSKTAYAQDQSCYTCHENFNTKYSVLHGPVAGGFCTSCHAPHYSENKKLLVRTGQALCLECHEQAQVLKNETHAEIGTKSCLECHNPHGGNDRSMSN